jgi:hypothetical protein
VVENPPALELELTSIVEETPEPPPIPVSSVVNTTPSGFFSLDSLIAAAPEVSEPPAPPEAPPWQAEAPAAAPVPTPPPSAEDSFYSDPLIQAALLKFEGKILN